MRPGGKLYAQLPNAAKLYERQIAKGLTRHRVQVERARHLLLQLWGGRRRPAPYASWTGGAQHLTQRCAADAR